MSLFRGLGFRKDATRGTTPIEVRKSLAGLFSATGVMPGGPSPLLTGNADWTYTVHGPAWFVATRGPSDGVALYGNDGDTIIGTTGVGSTVPIAPGAGLSRIDIALDEAPERWRERRPGNDRRPRLRAAVRGRVRHGCVLVPCCPGDPGGRDRARPQHHDQRGHVHGLGG